MLGPHRGFWDVHSMSVEVPSTEALVLLKLSHFFWPFQWRKTALDIVALSSSRPWSYDIRPESILAGLDKHSLEHHRALFRDALFEAADRAYHDTTMLPDPNAKRMIRSDDTNHFSQLTNPHEKFETVLSLIEGRAKIVLSDFLKRRAGGSDLAVVTWFNDPSVNLEMIAKELWYRALESVCTNRETWLRDESPSFSSFLRRIDPDTYHKLILLEESDGQGSTSMRVPPVDAIQRINLSEVPLVSREKLCRYKQRKDLNRDFPHASNPMVLFIISQIQRLIHPSPTFLSIVESYLKDSFPMALPLPMELWSLIMSNLDYISLCRASQVSRVHLNISKAQDGQMWRHLAQKIFSRELVEQKHSAENSWMVTFSSCLEIKLHGTFGDYDSDEFEWMSS